MLTGHGRASKAQIQLSVKSRLKLNVIPEPNDIADALALAICHWENMNPISNEQYSLVKS